MRLSALLSWPLRLVVCLLLCVAVSLLSPSSAPRAHADGGAPNLAYVSGGARGISVIDIQQQKVTNTFALAGDPQTIYLSLDGRFLYVTQPALDRVSLLSAKTGGTVCTVRVPGQPSLLAFDPGPNVLYAAGSGAASITAFDATTCAVKSTLQADGPVYGLAIANIATSSTGNQLWVATAQALSVFQDGRHLASIRIPGEPQYVNIPQGTQVYVTTRQGGLYAVDLGTRQVSPRLLSGGPFGPMDYDAYTGQVYVPDPAHHQLDVLAPVVSSAPPYPREPDHVIHLDDSPRSVAITSDGQFGFIALDGGRVAMLDVPGKQLFTTLSVGGTPRFIITGLYPPLVGTTPQEATRWSTWLSIAAYTLVIALGVIPLWLLWRHHRTTLAGKGKRGVSGKGKGPG